MILIERQKGSRRFDMPIEFPLEDSQRVTVIQDRRRLPDRRNAEQGNDDLKVIPAKMNSLTIVSLIIAINTAFVLITYALMVAIQN
jgi:hypothetical protein